MNALSNQMQKAMQVSLSQLRQKVLGDMTGKGEAIKKRPALKDDKNNYHTIKTHPVIQRNNETTIASFGMGVPGLDAMVEMAVDVAVELYDDRKAAHARPQDSLKLTPKQELEVRERNRMDMEVFKSLDEKLGILDTYLAMGYDKGVIHNGELVPLDQIASPKLEMKTKGPEADNYDFAPSANINAAPSIKMGAVFGR